MWKCNLDISCVSERSLKRNRKIGCMNIEHLRKCSSKQSERKRRTLCCALFAQSTCTEDHRFNSWIKTFNTKQAKRKEKKETKKRSLRISLPNIIEYTHNGRILFVLVFFQLHTECECVYLVLSIVSWHKTGLFYAQNIFPCICRWSIYLYACVCVFYSLYAPAQSNSVISPAISFTS